MPTQYAGSSSLKCTVCHHEIKLGMATGRKSGKPFLMLVCPHDGRHFRGFISDRDYIAEVVDRVEAL